MRTRQRALPATPPSSASCPRMPRLAIQSNTGSISCCQLSLSTSGQRETMTSTTKGSSAVSSISRTYSSGPRRPRSVTHLSTLQSGHGGSGRARVGRRCRGCTAQALARPNFLNVLCPGGWLSKGRVRVNPVARQADQRPCGMHRLAKTSYSPMQGAQATLHKAGQCTRARHERGGWRGLLLPPCTPRRVRCRLLRGLK